MEEKGQKNSWEGQWIVYKKRRESEVSKNKDKKIVIIKLKILNKKGKNKRKKLVW
jgi:hypothetical protein